MNVHKLSKTIDKSAFEEWPFTNTQSNYTIIANDNSDFPKASGVLFDGGRGYQTRYGLWSCTRGIFECTEQGDELCTILQGKPKSNPNLHHIALGHIFVVMNHTSYL
jgi:uncharacterized cupin superfamily protein